MANASSKVLYAALAGNLLVTVTKFIAAAITHSSAMLSEAVHSLVDTTNEVLLIYGEHQATRQADASHPLGYGRELYFWSFVVALLIFTVGAGVSTFQGVMHILNPVELERPVVNYVVLGVAFVFELGSWVVAFREFRARKGSDGYIEAAVETRDPSTLMVFFEDSAAMAGIAIALGGTLATHLTGNPVYDGAASICIGLLLGVIATFLVYENKKLLIGEPARPEMVRSIAQIATEDPCIAKFNGLITIHIGPRQIVASLSLHFDPTLCGPRLEEAAERLEDRVRKKHPDITTLLIKPQSPERYRETLASRWQEPDEG